MSLHWANIIFDELTERTTTTTPYHILVMPNKILCSGLSVKGNNQIFTTVFRCLSPFKIGINIYLEQSVWADLPWNPFQKPIASNHSRKNCQGNIWILAKVIFNFSAKIRFFGLTWRVTLHSEELAIQNYLSSKNVCICWWKISNCFQKHFWWMWSISFKTFWRPSVTGRKKGHFLPFLAPYYV